MAFSTIGPAGLTKAWRSTNGGRRLTFREGADGGLTFTIFLSRRFMPEFLYAAAAFRGRIYRLCWKGKA